MHTEFIIDFVDVEYIYVEGAQNAEVCLIGDTDIARQATATVRSIEDGTATGGVIEEHWLCYYV